MRQFSIVCLFLLLTTVHNAPARAADCNGNDVVDSREIADGLREDCNGNNVPDECEISPVDLALTGGVTSEVAPRALAVGDFDGDGREDLVTANSSGATAFTVFLGREEDFEPLEFSWDGRAWDLVVADLNLDGNSDVVAVGGSGVVLLGDGTGHLERTQDFDVRRGAFSVVASDLDGDDAPEVIVTNKDEDLLEVFRNLGDGSGMVAAPIELPTGRKPLDTVAVDLDLDGDLDLVSTSREDFELSVLFGEGDLTFPKKVRVPVPADLRVRDITTADLNSDSFPDLAVTATSAIIIFRNQKGGSFAEPQVFHLASAIGLATADFDADGDIDLATTASGGAVILPNRGDGVFMTSFHFAVEAQPDKLVALDANGDGDMDLALAISGGGPVVFLSNGEESILTLDAQRVTIGHEPHSVTAGDMDGDGDVDLVTVNGHCATVSLLRNLSDRIPDAPFRHRNVFGIDNTFLFSVASADFNGDGSLDLAIADLDGGAVFILRNAGTGAFTLNANLRPWGHPFFVTVGDLTGDGRAEIVSVSENGRALTVFDNDGAGNFQPRDPIRVLGTPRAAVIADFNLDGAMDVATSLHSASQVLVYLNDGAGELVPSEPLETRLPVHVNAADVTGDGLCDIVAVSDTMRSVTVFENLGKAVFRPHTVVRVADPPYSSTSGDINGDGFLDLVVSSQHLGTVSILLNDEGRSLVPFSFKSGEDTRFSVVGDWNNDGDVDVAGANHTSRDVTILWNRSTDDSGPPFLEAICTPKEFDQVSIPTDEFVVNPAPPRLPDRVTKYIVPAAPEATLPPMFQNVQRFPLHEKFLADRFPNEFPIDSYDALVNRRATRGYFVGNLYHLQTADGPVYGFNVLGAFESDPRELPTMEEVGSVFATLRAVFHLEPLMYFPNQGLTRESARRWKKPPFPIFFFDPAALIDFEAYTAGVGFGRMRILNQDQFQTANERGQLGAQDFLVLEFAPRNIEGVVGGLVTADRQEELSHSRVLLARRGTPNAFLKGALAELADWNNQLVRVEVTCDGLEVQRAAVEEAEEFWRNSRPSLSTPPTVDPDFDEILTLREIADLDLTAEPFPVEARFGGKASNLARLQRLLSDPANPEMHQYVEHGFAIPAHYYLEFMRSNVMPSYLDPNRAATYEEYITELLTDEQFVNRSEVRFEALELLRLNMRVASEVNGELVSRLAAKIGSVYESTTDRARFRSSSNIEDALEFNGAGLYDSTSVCAADDLDDEDDGPSRCDPTREAERGIARGLRRVWSSLWNFRAFEERSFYGVSHELAAMGILSNRAFVDERVNGVAFTGNISDPTDRRYVVTAQIGENSVVNPEPGVRAEKTFLTVEDGEVIRIEREILSSLVDPGEAVMTDAQLTELGEFLWFVDHNFPLKTGDYPREAVLLDFEFKIEASGDLAVKQVRPFLVSEALPADPIFALDVPVGTETCGVFVHSREARDALELKSRIRWRGGRVELPTATSTFTGELFAEVLVGRRGLLARPVAPGQFRVRRSAAHRCGNLADSVTTYVFSFTQRFAVPDGSSFVLQLDQLEFEARGDESTTAVQVADEEFLTRRLLLSGVLEAVTVTGVPVFSSCTYEQLPLWNLRVLAADGFAAELLERFEPPVDINDTGPAALIEAHVHFPAQGSQAVDDYWRLVYAAARHNLRVRYWVLLDVPVTIPGFAQRALAVEIAAPDEILGLDGAVTYLDAALQPFHSVALNAFERVPFEGVLFLRGDANSDAAVGLGDAIFILNYLVRGGARPTCLNAADANDDGGVNIADAIATLNHLFGGAGPLPPPSQVCGADLTDPAGGDAGCEAYGPCER